MNWVSVDACGAGVTHLETSAKEHLNPVGLNVIVIFMFCFLASTVAICISALFSGPYNQFCGL
jgi:hypothetical protein